MPPLELDVHARATIAEIDRFLTERDQGGG
jgi:hypothetical protein